MSSDDTEVLAELLTEMRLTRQAVERLAEVPAPITTVSQAAEVLGCSRSTIERRIARLPAELRPAGVDAGGRAWWPSREACLTWWDRTGRVAATASTTASKRPKTPRRRAAGKTAPYTPLSDLDSILEE